MTIGAADFSKTSKSEEQYTPREWWQRVIMVMGAIDVDPSSDPEMRIPAKVHYTKKENGLIQPWCSQDGGRIYCNPPFGHGVNEWFEKLRDEMAADRCVEAIILWKAALETKATRTLIHIPEYRISAVPKNRISFLGGKTEDKFPEKRSDGDVATFTPIFYYFGPHEEKFIRIFSPHCTLWKPLRVSKNQSLLVKS